MPLRQYLPFLLVLLLPTLLMARTRKDQEPPSLLELLPSATSLWSPSTWQQGMPFLLLRPDVGLSLVPEQPTLAVPTSDTLSLQGSLWRYDSMVSEEDWMGQQLLQLRFLSPQGVAYRFSTGQPMSVVSDVAYQPVISCLYPQQLIQQVDSLLRARTLYILINDERVHYATDTLPGSHHPKFVPIVVDSVTCGSEVAPLTVAFHTVQGQERGTFQASLPGSRQEGTSTALTRFLSTTDPYLLHPDITPETWQLIQTNSLRLDMTAEEVRLSWGRPSRVEKGASRTGMIELWHYSNNRVLQLWDGRLYKIGIL